MKAKICGGNIKLGNMGSFSKVMGNDTVTDGNISCVGSCSKYCSECGCAMSCYVRASYRYKSVRTRHIINTLAMRENLDSVYNDLYLQMYRKRNKFLVVRINQSGELETESEFKMWCRLASDFPMTEFYVYTKAFDLVTPTLLNGGCPNNLTVLFSIWHTYGLNEYKVVAHLPNVKAFVYCDGFNYEMVGLKINTYCMAYAKDGKLDHNITCDKCRKCFNRLDSCKVVGCNAH